MSSRPLRLAMLVSLLVVPLAAQQGSVSGKLVGLDGKAAHNAKVVLRQLDGAGTNTLPVGDSGEFQFTGVHPGTYIVDACGADFIASQLVNVGPSPYEKNPNQTVSLSPVPKRDEESTGMATILVVALLLAVGLFWFAYPITPFFLRVPIIIWASVASLCFLLYSKQHALLTLTQHDAAWVGAYLVFVMIAIWQTASTIAAGAGARFGAAHNAWLSYLRNKMAASLGQARYKDLSGFLRTARPLVLYFVPILIFLLFLAINSWHSGTREWGDFVSKGAVAGYLTWLAVSLIFGAIVQFWRTRSLKSWPKLYGWSQVSLTVLMGLIAYWFQYRGRAGTVGSPYLTLGSPIIHVFVLLGELCLLLSALTYFLDTYRIPLLTILVVLIGIGTVLNRGDYTFESTAPAGPRPSPSDAIAGRERIIAVAAAGGGVQAAAWTARVLGGLSEADQRFQPTVRLLSGVSGGSVGTMYFMNTYPTTQGGKGWSGDEAFRSAGKPLLDAVAWGLVNVDTRNVLALTRSADRGAILSRTLGTRAGLSDTPLTRWSDKVTSGLPAVLLNATEVETGSPIVFSSTTLNNYGILDFAQVYHRDVDIPTAVRMSASFPFVTPVTRLQGYDGQGHPFPHLADGGYYDNYGLYSLMAWLQKALAGSGQPPEVLVLRIESFPTTVEKTEAQGWPFQTWAPLTAMMSVRTAAQRQRDETDLRLFQQQYRPGLIREVTVRYEPPCGCPDPPLSWDLSPVEIQCLDRAWQSRNVQEAAQVVQKFLDAR